MLFINSLVKFHPFCPEWPAVGCNYFRALNYFVDVRTQIHFQPWKWRHWSTVRQLYAFRYHRILSVDFDQITVTVFPLDHESESTFRHHLNNKVDTGFRDITLSISTIELSSQIWKIVETTQAVRISKSAVSRSTRSRQVIISWYFPVISQCFSWHFNSVFARRSQSGNIP